MERLKFRLATLSKRHKAFYSAVFVLLFAAVFLTFAFAAMPSGSKYFENISEDSTNVTSVDLMNATNATLVEIVGNQTLFENSSLTNSSKSRSLKSEVLPIQHRL